MTYTAHDVRKNWAYMSDAEIEALQNLVQSLPDNPVVINVGAGAGVSGLAIFQARDDVTLYTIDINWRSPLGSLDGELDSFRQAGIVKNPRHHQVLGDSRKVASEWTTISPSTIADLIFIDDGHSREDITGDILGWINYVKEGGIMAFHDYGSNDWPAVKEVVNKYMADLQIIVHTDTLIAFRVQ